MADKKTSASLPASGAGLLRFFEDETKGVKVDPKIVVSVPTVSYTHLTLPTTPYV